MHGIIAAYGENKRLNAFINTLWEHIERKLPQIVLMSPFYDVSTMKSSDGIHNNATGLRFMKNFIREIVFPKEKT